MQTISKQEVMKIDPRWAGVRNLRMAERLSQGKALSVRDEGRPLGAVECGFFLLRRFVEDVDYCDPIKEEWIRSIGRRLEDGEIHASTSEEFFGNALYECLFIR
jgi:hypothetical protein